MTNTVPLVRSEKRRHCKTEEKRGEEQHRVRHTNQKEMQKHNYPNIINTWWEMWEGRKRREVEQGEIGGNKRTRNRRVRKARDEHREKGEERSRRREVRKGKQRSGREERAQGRGSKKRERREGKGREKMEARKAREGG